jgi:hypothetical protein
MTKRTRKPMTTQPTTRTTTVERWTELDDVRLAKVIGGCTNENLSEWQIK